MNIQDAGHLARIRKDCELSNIDFTRGTIKVDAEGEFVVHLDRPLFEIGSFVESVPSGRSFVSALQAEGYLLQSLLVIQRAERQRVRLGRVVGWDTASIVRTPVNEAELAEFRAHIDHRNRVERLRTELAEAVRAKQTKAAAETDAAGIRKRYGISLQPEAQVADAPADAQDVPPAAFDPGAILAALGADHANQPVQVPVYAGKRLAAQGKTKSPRGK